MFTNFREMLQVERLKCVFANDKLLDKYGNKLQTFADMMTHIFVFMRNACMVPLNDALHHVFIAVPVHVIRLFFFTFCSALYCYVILPSVPPINKSFTGSTLSSTGLCLLFSSHFFQLVVILVIF